jgi:hypothetical protein
MLYIIANDYFLTHFLLESVSGRDDISVIFHPKRQRGLRRSILKHFEAVSIRWQGRSLIYDSEYVERLKVIEENDSVLLFGIENLSELRMVRRLIKARKVTLFLWNPLLNRNRIERHRRVYVEALKEMAFLCTFDPDDAARFGLQLVPQVYRDVTSFQQEEVTTDVDVYFVGQDKGRLAELVRLERLLQEAGLTTHFHIIRDNRASYSSEELPHLSTKGLSYEDNIEMIRHSRCLLELLQNNQSGLTMRSLEAAFFGKKLITDNMRMVESELYDPARVFLIGRDNLERLHEFVMLPCPTVMQTFLDQHDFRYWCEQFA